MENAALLIPHTVSTNLTFWPALLPSSWNRESTGQGKICHLKPRPPSLPHRRKVSQNCQHYSSISSPGMPAGQGSQPSASCQSEKTPQEWGNCGSADHDVTAGHWVGQQPGGLKCLVSLAGTWVPDARQKLEGYRLYFLTENLWDFKTFPNQLWQLTENTEGVLKSLGNMERKRSPSKPTSWWEGNPSTHPQHRHLPPDP